jgi:hypothetical protein
MGGTACKVPYATDYIQKTIARGAYRKRIWQGAKKIPPSGGTGFQLRAVMPVIKK